MLTDLYVLASERSTLVAKHFKDTWLTDFDEVASEYEFPQYADEPFVVYSSATDLIEKLVATPNETYSIYWNNPQRGSVSSGMLFFTYDSAMIVGISVATDAPKDIANYLQELSKTVDGKFGYAVFEEPAPDTAQDFINIAKTLQPPKIIEGTLIFT